MIYTFEDFELDLRTFELRQNGSGCQMEPQVFDLLAHLVSNHERVVPKQELMDHLWPERYISEAALASRVMAARKVIGDNGRDQRAIRTVHGRGFRFVVPVRTSQNGSAVVDPKSADHVTHANGHPAPAGAAGLVHTSPAAYARTSDGMNIAYSVAGSGLPLVRTVGWFTHLDIEWKWKRGNEFWGRFARHHRLVRFDSRGMGLSDPTDEFPLESRVRDLEAVVDALGLERFALFGISSGIYQAVLYAARNPERVTHLIAYGGGPDGDDEAENAEWLRHWDLLRKLMRQGWEVETPLYRQLFTQLILGEEASPEEVHDFNELMRKSISGRGASRFTAMTLAEGVTEAAQRLKCPTLVMHRRDDHLVPFSRSRRLAALVPGARLMPIDGTAHWPVLDASATEQMAHAIEEFTGAAL